MTDQGALEHGIEVEQGDDPDRCADDLALVTGYQEREGDPASGPSYPFEYMDLPGPTLPRPESVGGQESCEYGGEKDSLPFERRQAT